MTDPVAEARQRTIDYMFNVSGGRNELLPEMEREADALIEAVRAEGLVAVHQAVLITNAQMNKRIAELEEALRDSRRHAISVLDRSREVLGE